MTQEDIAVRSWYRAKRPVRLHPIVAAVNEREFNDRYVIWRSGREVQYDGPTVKDGAKYPTVSIDKFLAWANNAIPDEERAECSND